MEMNPNHPVTAATSDLWHKIAALLVRRLVAAEGKHPAPDAAVVITVSDIEALSESEDAAITIRLDDARGIVLNMVSTEEAERLARKEGGLPS